MIRYTKLFVAALIGILLAGSMSLSSPAHAQEDELNTTLARAAAKSFLTTLTRPELEATRQFYAADSLRTESILETVGEVTSVNIVRSGWVTPDETFEVEATLQPGNRTLLVRTGQEGGRWKVTGLELPMAQVAPANAAAVTPAQGIQPVAGNGTGKLVFQTQNGGEIYAINADGTGLQYVTNGMDPQLSPDGSRITFTRWDPRYELFTINVDGTDERAWFSGKRQMKSPTWSADGSKLVFSHQAGGRLDGQLKRVSLNSLARRAAKGEDLPEIPDYARGVEVKDGVLQYFIPPDAYWWLAMIDLENEEYSDLSTGARYNYAPSFNPANPDEFIFRSDQGMGLYNDAAQTSRPVSYDDRDRGAISISPDGSKVAFTYYQDGNWEIHTMNIDGSNRQRLTETPLSVLAERNTAGNSVYINEEGFRTMARAQPESMPNLNWNNAAPTWSPDGSQIAFVSDRSGQWDIWIMNADGSDQRPMFPNGALDGIDLRFDGVDERMLSWQ